MIILLLFSWWIY